MQLETNDIVAIVTALGVLAGLYLNWQRDRTNTRKQERDELRADFERVCKERDDLVKKLFEARDECEQREKSWVGEYEKLKSRLAEKDETIINLSRKVAST